jgi:hypothetical protein
MMLFELQSLCKPFFLLCMMWAASIHRISPCRNMQPQLEYVLLLHHFPHSGVMMVTIQFEFVLAHSRTACFECFVTAGKVLRKRLCYIFDMQYIFSHRCEQHTILRIRMLLKI